MHYINCGRLLWKCDAAYYVNTEPFAELFDVILWSTLFRLLSEPVASVALMVICQNFGFAFSIVLWCCEAPNYINKSVVSFWLVLR